ncbi:MAG: VCBS repeat-containing protein [Saprospiraceae bacterium]|nr:VCBS repeat-containing protein [Saprospiraceae bacterium]
MRVFYIIVVLIFGYSIINGQNFVSFANKTTKLKSGVETNNLIPGGFLDLNGDLVDDIVVVDKGFRLHTFEGNVLEKPLFQHISEDFPHYFDAFAMLVCDVNGDEKQDVFLGGSFGYIQLYLSTPTGIENIKIPVPFLIQTMNAADINTDGFPDLFVCNDDGKNEIFINNGSGAFTSNDDFIDFKTNPTSDMSGNYGSVWVDVNGDKYPDLAIAKCRAGVSSPADPRRINTLFIRQPNGTYIDKAKEYNFDLGEQSWAVTFADYDNDGDMDAFVANHYDPHVMLENVEGDYFRKKIFTENSVSSFAFQTISRDFDNDGLLDIILSGLEGISFLHNKGNLFFEYIHVFDRPLFGMSMQVGDINDDGFVDFHTSVNQPLNFPGDFPDQLYVNNANDNHFFACNLKGSKRNTLAVGARLSLYGPWGIQTRQIVAGESYGITTSYQQHFGLGQFTTIDSLVVDWPGGERQVYTGLEIDATYYIQKDLCAKKVIDLYGESKILDNGGETVLDALTGFSSYKWNTGDTTQQISVREKGTYFVKMVDNTGCISYSKPVYVETGCFEGNINLLNTENKITLCQGTSVRLEANTAQTYLWNTGETTSVVDVSDEGVYTITATDYCGVTLNDTVEVFVINSLLPAILYEDTIKKGANVTFNSDLQNTIWLAEDGFTELGYGQTFLLQNIEKDTLIFAQSRLDIPQVSAEVGLKNFPSLSSYGSNSVNSGLKFSVFQPMVIKSVKVYTDKPGKRKLTILDADGLKVFEKEFQCVFGENILPLNAEIGTGMDYEMTTDRLFNIENLGHAGPRFLRNSGQQIEYPFEIDQVVSITESLHGISYYYFFYDWQVDFSKGTCFSDLIPLPVTVDFTNNTSEAIQTSGCFFSPNPFNNEINLMNCQINDDFKIQIFNVLGNKLIDEKVVKSQQTINTEMLSPGMYIIQINKDHIIYNQKIVKTTSKP